MESPLENVCGITSEAAGIYSLVNPPSISESRYDCINCQNEYSDYRAVEGKFICVWANKPSPDNKNPQYNQL